MFMVCITRAIYKSVDIKDGQLEIIGWENCEINANGKVINMTKGRQMGLYFGLITYKCDTDYGYKISKMNCKECGIYCVYNDYISGCQNEKMQLVVGIFVGLILGPIACFAIWKCYGKCLNACYHSNVAKRQRRNDKVELEHSLRINALTGVSSRPAFNDKYNIVKYKKKAHKYREVAKSMRPDDYITVIDDVALGSINEDAPGNSSIRACSDTNEKQFDKFEEHKGECCYEEIPIFGNNNANCSTNADSTVVSKDDTKANLIKPRGFKVNKNRYPTILMLVFIFNLINTIVACDMSYYLTSDGKVCDEQNCKETTIHMFPLVYGNHICFKDHVGSVTSFKISRAVERVRYNLLYYTSDYDVCVQTHWVCEGKEECNKKDCRLGVRYNGFNDKHDLDFYNCETSHGPCDSYCFWNTACVYYNYWIKIVGKSYPVYFLVSYIWEIDVSFEIKGITTTKTINVNNPSTYLKTTDSIITNNGLPISITSVDYERIVNYRTGLIINNELTYVTSSDINLPVSGQLGELQIPISNSNKTIIMDKSSVQCKSDNCEVKCLKRESSLSRVLSRPDGYPSSPITKILNNGLTIEVESNIRPSVMVSIGDADIESLYVMPAKCNIEVIETYGCTGCEQRPFAILMANNIESEGVLSYDSNCTFDRKYLSCNPEPYIIYLSENYNQCHIYSLMSNISIDFGVKYTFKGSLNMISYKSSTETVSGVMYSIATSKPFIVSAASTIITCTIVSTVATTLVKLIRAYSITRVKKDVEST